MTVFNRLESDEKSLTITLDKGSQTSFGICIVRGEVKDSPHHKVSGIFIKEIVPQSCASKSGKLKVGDRILSLNNNDVRNANEETVFNLIRSSGQSIVLQVQTFDKIDKIHKIENKNITSSKVTEKSSLQNGDTKQENKSGSNSVISKLHRTPPESDEDEDEEDTRDMTGKTASVAGYEIDRASAGNIKRKEAEIANDPEQEDEFGYTLNKIKKRYGNLGPVHKTELIRESNTELGLALAGHKDRTKMACVIAGINPDGLAANANLKCGDEILEVNGHVLQYRCHLNASVIFKNLIGEKVVFVILRRTSPILAVKPVKQFPVTIDETEHLFTTYKNVKKIQIQKTGTSLGIMIIEGKHKEVGQGIFISDLQAESTAEKAGLNVGEMILAINKDVIVDTNYDTAAGILKRAEGLVTLIVCNLKSEEQMALEEAEKIKAEEKKNAPPPEPEKPQDPGTAEIKTNRKTLIEVKVEKKPLGCMVVGGKDNFVTTGVVVTQIFPDGVFATDKRLQIFDQILEFNGTPLKTNEMSTMKCHQFFNLEYDRITLMVWRNDPSELESIKIEITKKAGKDFGLALASNPKGVVVVNMIPSGYIDIDSKIQKGDIINKLNGDNLEGCSYEECFALFRAATGKCNIEVLRPKPTDH